MRVGPVLCRNEGLGKGKGSAFSHWPPGGCSLLRTLRIDGGEEGAGDGQQDCIFCRLYVSLDFGG
jgi:hypothetical protein